MRFGCFPSGGLLMNRRLLALLAPILAGFCLAACSGLPSSGGGGGAGNGSLILTMSANPLTPPPSTSVLSFSFSVSGVSLTPSSGSPINIPLPGSTFTVDLTRLESDSAFLGSVLNAVPAGTYTNVTLAITGSSLTYCTQLNPGTQGCANGSVTTVSGAAAAPVISKSITITSNQTTALRIQVDLASALTINSSTQVVTAVNLGAANVFSAAALPPSASSLSTGQLDFIEDFTGVVTALTSSSVTVTTSKHGAITAAANSSTFFSPNCTAATPSLSACAAQNQLAAIDVALNSDGTFTLLEFDPLEPTASDWIEGLVTAVPSSSTQFQIVANDIFLAPTSSLIGNNLSIGDPVTVNLATGATFGVDTKGLIVPADATTFESANDTSVLRAGQTVAVRVASFTAAGSSTPASVSADFVGLRFSRVTGGVASSSPPNVFFINNLPPFFGVTGQLQVQLNQAVSPDTAPTNFDGVPAFSSFTTGQTVSIRALYFGATSATPFTAAKVRTH